MLHIFGHNCLLSINCSREKDIGQVVDWFWMLGFSKKFCRKTYYSKPIHDLTDIFFKSANFDHASRHTYKLLASKWIITSTCCTQSPSLTSYKTSESFGTLSFWCIFAFSMNADRTNLNRFHLFSVMIISRKSYIDYL